MASKINKILTNRSQEFSNDELANVSASLSAILGQGGGGAPCASAWLPYVNSDGDISWRLSMTTIAPATANIMGPEGPSGAKGDKGDKGDQGIQGIQGAQGPQGDPGATPTFRINSSTNYWEVSYNSGSTWTSLDTSATGPKGDTGDKGATGATGATGPEGPQGPAGADGKNGTNGAAGADGISPTFTVTQITSGHSVTISGAQGSTAFNVLDGANGKDGTNGTNGTDGKDGDDGDDGFSPTMSFTEAATSVDHENGGTIVTFTYGAGGSQTTAYTAWNGNNGSGGGGSTYTAGEGIDIDNDVISFSGAQVAAGEMILAGNGTVDSPFNTTGFYEDYLDNLAAINGDVAVVSAAVAAMGGAIKIIGNASCTYIDNLQTSNIHPGDAYLATTDGTVGGLDVETGQWKSFTVHSGDMVVLSISNNTKVVSVLATTPNLTQYAKLNQRTIVKAGVGVTVSRTENSDGAVEYTVNTVGGGGEGSLSAYTVTCSGDNRFDFERSVDPVTSAINYNMTTTMPNFINVTATPTGTLTPNSYYFVYEE